MTKYAIIVAGGTGSRMGAHLPKQFLLLKAVLAGLLQVLLLLFPVRLLITREALLVTLMISKKRFLM